MIKQTLSERINWFQRDSPNPKRIWCYRRKTLPLAPCGEWRKQLVIGCPHPEFICAGTPAPFTKTLGSQDDWTCLIRAQTSNVKSIPTVSFDASATCEMNCTCQVRVLRLIRSIPARTLLREWVINNLTYRFHRYNVETWGLNWTLLKLRG